jgi:hypothetical protein
MMKSLLFALALALLAPAACAVHTAEADIGIRSVAVSVSGRPRCSPSRYWDGERCVRRHYHWRRAYYRPHYYHYYYYDD